MSVAPARPTDIAPAGTLELPYSERLSLRLDRSRRGRVLGWTAFAALTQAEQELTASIGNGEPLTHAGVFWDLALLIRKAPDQRLDSPVHTLAWNSEVDALCHGIDQLGEVAAGVLAALQGPFVPDAPAVSVSADRAIGLGAIASDAERRGDTATAAALWSFCADAWAGVDGVPHGFASSAEQGREAVERSAGLTSGRSEIDVGETFPSEVLTRPWYADFVLVGPGQLPDDEDDEPDAGPVNPSGTFWFGRVDGGGVWGGVPVSIPALPLTLWFDSMDTTSLRAIALPVDPDDDCTSVLEALFGPEFFRSLRIAFEKEQTSVQVRLPAARAALRALGASAALSADAEALALLDPPQPARAEIRDRAVYFCLLEQAFLLGSYDSQNSAPLKDGGPLPIAGPILLRALRPAAEAALARARGLRSSSSFPQLGAATTQVRELLGRTGEPAKGLLGPGGGVRPESLGTLEVLEPLTGSGGSRVTWSRDAGTADVTLPSGRTVPAVLTRDGPGWIDMALGDAEPAMLSGLGVAGRLAFKAPARPGLATGGVSAGGTTLTPTVTEIWADDLPRAPGDTAYGTDERLRHPQNLNVLLTHAELYVDEYAGTAARRLAAVELSRRLVDRAISPAEARLLPPPRPRRSPAATVCRPRGLARPPDTVVTEPVVLQPEVSSTLLGTRADAIFDLRSRLWFQRRADGYPLEECSAKWREVRARWLAWLEDVERDPAYRAIEPEALAQLKTSMAEVAQSRLDREAKAWTSKRSDRETHWALHVWPAVVRDLNLLRHSATVGHTGSCLDRRQGRRLVFRVAPPSLASPEKLDFSRPAELSIEPRDEGAYRVQHLVKAREGLDLKFEARARHGCACGTLTAAPAP